MYLSIYLFIYVWLSYNVFSHCESFSPQCSSQVSSFILCIHLIQSSTLAYRVCLHLTPEFPKALSCAEINQ